MDQTGSSNSSAQQALSQILPANAAHETAANSTSTLVPFQHFGHYGLPNPQANFIHSPTLPNTVTLQISLSESTGTVIIEVSEEAHSIDVELSQSLESELANQSYQARQSVGYPAFEPARGNVLQTAGSQHNSQISGQPQLKNIFSEEPLASEGQHCEFNGIVQNGLDLPPNQRALNGINQFPSIQQYELQNSAEINGQQDDGEWFSPYQQQFSGLNLNFRRHL